MSADTSSPTTARRMLPILPTSEPPERASRLIHDFTPDLIDVGAHHLCPGCGEPIAMRSIVEAVAEADAIAKAVAIFGIGCYTARCCRRCTGEPRPSPPESSAPGPTFSSSRSKVMATW
jgi:hypothetical protein